MNTNITQKILVFLFFFFFRGEMLGIPLINIWYDVMEGSAMVGDGVRPIRVSKCETSRCLYIVGLYTEHIRRLWFDHLSIILPTHPWTFPARIRYLLYNNSL